MAVPLPAGSPSKGHARSAISVTGRAIGHMLTSAQSLSNLGTKLTAGADRNPRPPSLPRSASLACGDLGLLRCAWRRLVPTRSRPSRNGPATLIRTPGMRSGLLAWYCASRISPDSARPGPLVVLDQATGASTQQRTTSAPGARRAVLVDGETLWRSDTVGKIMAVFYWPP